MLHRKVSLKLLRIITLCLSFALALPVSATPTASEAIFDYFDYQGQDPAGRVGTPRYDQYRNPILLGFYPDPSVVRVGRYYYLVNSSFAFYPGLPVWRSSDLITWVQIGNAIDRPEMFDFTLLGVSRAVFAPTIRHHAGAFYIVGTCVDCGGNFIVSAKDPAGRWSDPVFLPSIDGIDPDLFFDDDGRAWIANNGPPRGAPKYDGHRALWMQQLDLKSLKMVGPRTMIVDGGVRFADKPIWTEGPHIIKRDGYYYLIAAEGGTAGNHSETVYRSRRVTGPYTPGPLNPILTQRDLDPARRLPVYATGHADFVRTQAGEWWAVFLGTRPFEANLSALGRETFMLPVHWPEGGWPMILPPKTSVPYFVRRPRLPNAFPIERDRRRDDFTDAKLSRDWVMLRTPKKSWYSLTTTPGSLTLTARPESLGDQGNPSFIAKRQAHQDVDVTTELRYSPRCIGDRAGMAIFADEQSYLFFGIERTATGPSLVMRQRSSASDPDDGRVMVTLPFKATTPVRLHIRVRGPTLSFFYGTGLGAEQTLIADVDGRHLASERSNQFTGAVIGPFAQRSAVNAD